jgi:hypothetical protein
MKRILPSALAILTVAVPPTQSVVIPSSRPGHRNVPLKVHTPLFNSALKGFSFLDLLFAVYGNKDRFSYFYRGLRIGTNPPDGLSPCPSAPEAARVARHRIIRSFIFAPPTKFFGRRARFLSRSSAGPRGGRGGSSWGNRFWRGRPGATPFLFGPAAC